MIFYCSTKKGFTLLLAVLISSLLLTIGLSIFNIAFKELTLSSSARESVSAFYAADSGAECALFWDIQQNSFENNKEILCEGQSFDMAGTGNGSWSFTLDNFTNGESCSVVTVVKDEEKTTIQSRGYNTCNTSNPRRVERAIRITY
jgi:hypothetical protein